MLSAAALLDELMGVDRDRAPDEKKTALHWSDPQVCKHFLCGFCPSQLFVNTRSDLGPCEKAHDERLRKELDELIKSTATAKQLLRMEREDLSSPKELGRKKGKLK